MTAIAIAEKTMTGGSFQGPYQRLLEFFAERYEVVDPATSAMLTAEDIMRDPTTDKFLKSLMNTTSVVRTTQIKQPTKKNSANLEERRGQYDPDRCDARIWKEKPRSGGLGFSDIQCVKMKMDGCNCLCKSHFKANEEGLLWTGLITEPRPENPIHPTAGPGRTPMPKAWSTDQEGNDVVKAKKSRNPSPEKKTRAPVKAKKEKAPEDMDIAELEKYLQVLKEKDEEKEKEKEKDEEKEKEKEEEKDEEKDEEKEKEKEEEKDEEKDEEKEKENGDDGWANDTEELSDGEDEELNKDGQLVEWAPPSDEVIGGNTEEKIDPVVKDDQAHVAEKEAEAREEEAKALITDTFEPEPENDEDKILEIDSKEDTEDEEDEEDGARLMEVDGVDYQINSDNTVIAVDEFIEVGVWDPVKEEIVFDDEE